MPKKVMPNEHESSDSGYKNEYDSGYDSGYDSFESKSESESEGSEEDIDWGYLGNRPSLKVETGKKDFKKALELVKKMTIATQKLTDKARDRPKPKPGKTRRNQKNKNREAFIKSGDQVSLDPRSLREAGYDPMNMNEFQDPVTKSSLSVILENFVISQIKNLPARPAKPTPSKETLSQKFGKEATAAAPAREGEQQGKGAAPAPKSPGRKGPR